MLSSIIQQSDCPLDLIVDIACLPQNGNPSTEKVAETFRCMGLDVRLTYIADIEVFAKRGLIRNIQIKNAIENEQDYIWFADADHVYHTKMFATLSKWLRVNGSNCHACVFSRSKRHTDTAATDQIMESTLHEMPYIANAYAKCYNFPYINHKDKKSGAPGNMQIVSISDIVNLAEGLYVDPAMCKDRHLFTYGQKARSDLAFRRRIGKSSAIQLPLQIHLNHIRDKEAGEHLEIQR